MILIFLLSAIFTGIIKIDILEILLIFKQFLKRLKREHKDSKPEV